jgi:hypothetical protein
VILCDERREPAPEGATIVYGQLTDGCRIAGNADADTFTFVGTAGDVVRFRVLSTTPGLDPRLELRDLSGTAVADTFCNGLDIFNRPTICSISLDHALAPTGTYRVTVSDKFVDESGGYILQLERIPPRPAPQELRYDSSVTMAGAVDPATDTDFFTFEGVAGTQVRVILSGRTPWLDPTLEIMGRTTLSSWTPSATAAISSTSPPSALSSSTDR